MQCVTQQASTARDSGQQQSKPSSAAALLRSCCCTAVTPAVLQASFFGIGPEAEYETENTADVGEPAALGGMSRVGLTGTSCYARSILPIDA
jgi:hypothetical protein